MKTKIKTQIFIGAIIFFAPLFIKMLYNAFCEDLADRIFHRFKAENTITKSSEKESNKTYFY